MEPTKQFRKRNAILACLRQCSTHPSAEELYQLLRKEDSDISLATVYRNLTLFKAQGLVCTVGTVHGIERFDGCVQPHTHFICTRCDSVRDVPQVDLPDAFCAQAAQQLSCRVDSAQLMLYGICNSCLSEQETTM